MPGAINVEFKFLGFFPLLIQLSLTVIRIAFVQHKNAIRGYLSSMNYRKVAGINISLSDFVGCSVLVPTRVRERPPAVESEVSSSTHFSASLITLKSESQI